MTTVGTGYVQIYPTTKGFSSKLSAGLGDEIASGSSAPMQSGLSKAFSGALGVLKGAAIAGGAVVGGVLAANMGSAISRVDTLNQFPQVMANMGIAAEASSASISKISQGLQGLPTSLDAGASAVQRFTSSNQDIDRSTDMFLALNNAIVAGGQSVGIQETALEQLSQAYSKGQMDMMEWRSLLTAMPAQLNQVASSMGMSTEALGEGLRNGTISMDTFMDSIIALNETGADGFASFAEQAQSATGGIATTMSTCGSAIQRGLADVLNNLAGQGLFSQIKDQALGLETVLKSLASGDASGAADAIVGMFTGMADSLSQFLPQMAQVGATVVVGLVQGIATSLPQMVDAALQAIAAFAMGIAQALPTLVPAIVGMITGIVDAIIQNLPILLEAGLQIIIGLITGLVQALPQLIAWLPTVITSMVEFFVTAIPMLVEAGVQLLTALVQNMPAIVSAVSAAMPQIVSALVSALITLTPLLIDAGVQLLVALVQNLPAIISGVVSAVPQIISGIVNAIGGAVPQMAQAGLNLMMGLAQGIGNAVGSVVSSAMSACGEVLESVKSFFGIASPSKLMAQMGGFLMGGLAKGIDASGVLVNRAMDRINGSLAANMITDVSPNVTGAIVAPGGTTYNTYLNDWQFNDARKMRDITIEELADMWQKGQM
jgi:tape measure domain-containing protein